MFTKRSVNYFGYLTNIFHRFKIVPIKWDKVSQRMTPGNSVHFVWYWLLSFHFYAYFAFQVYQFYQESQKSEPNYANIIFIIIWVIGYFWMILSSMNNYVKRYEMSIFCNHLFKINFLYESK